jgi:hypothetical protein
VEAPGTAPGSEELISTPFIAIAAQGGAGNIRIMAHFSKRKTKSPKDRRLRGATVGGFLGFGGERISDAEKEVLAQISPALGLRGLIDPPTPGTVAASVKSREHIGQRAETLLYVADVDSEPPGRPDSG